MKTVDLKNESPSVGELLAMARKKSVLVISTDGGAFVLEEAGDFDREVAELGNSERFMKFLKRRSREKGVTSIEQVSDELNQMHNRVGQPAHGPARPRPQKRRLRRLVHRKE